MSVLLTINFKTSQLFWDFNVNYFVCFFFLSFQWHWDVNQKVMLTNEKPIPVLLLANKVRHMLFK